MDKKFGSEKYTVQNKIIDYVSQPKAEYSTSSGEKFYLNLGWEYVSPQEALRLKGGKDGIVFKEVFINQLKKLNDFITPELAQEVLEKIKNIPSNIKGNFIAWEYLKGLKTVFVPSEKRERNVKIIDTENIENNIFQVTDEFTFSNGRKEIRADIVFLINGIPIIIIETKASHKIDGISEAFEQIKRYHLETPEFMAVLQVYAITHLIKFFYGATWNTSFKKLINWKEEVSGDFETLVKAFFDKKRIVELITDFILFTKQDDELKKVILRPHQIRAINKIEERAKSDKKRGLVWHTQGSGKTYTMIVAAQRILKNPIFNNPTVIMLVDRNELESQLFSNIKAVGIESVIVAKSKEHLRELLENDTRGLIVSMLHKFEGMSANINTRDNIFVFIDEAHRTTNGKLGNYLMGALPNATYIGFTGTPIDKTNKGTGTFVIFGKDDFPHGYLDKYSIAESIEEGTTVPLHYTLAPSDLLVDKETLEKEFLNLKEVEGINDMEVLNRILERAVNLKNMLKSKERIEKIAEYIANHFKEHVEPMGYKAFVVAVDREACAMYKEELNKHLPPDYSQVVISQYHNDPSELVKHYLSEEEEKIIRRKFRNPDELPKILIVTEKLLTGFDAPILYCMYLDKPMRDHVLLQTMARVNRPYEDETGRKKIAGFVLDFVGIFDNFQKALAFDSKDIEGVVRDLNLLKESFKEKIQVANEYLSLVYGKPEDKAVEKILEYFIDEQERQKYYRFYREISNIYEILSPDPFLRPFMNDFENLTKIYMILRENYEPRTPIDKDLTRKVAKLVQESTKLSRILESSEIYEINENLLEILKESNASDIQKVFNLVKSIENLVSKEALKSPYLKEIGKMVTSILEEYKSRQKSTLDVLEELKKIIEEINSSKRKQAEKNMNGNIFTVFWVLKREGIDEAEEIANKMSNILEGCSFWKQSEEQERQIRKEFYKLLANKTSIDKQTEIVQKVLILLKESNEI